MRYSKTLYVSSLILFSVLSVAAQQHSGKISGRLLEAPTGMPLEGVTVTAMDDLNGSFLAYTISNRKGYFTISGLPLQRKVVVTAAFDGYRDSTVVVTLTNAKDPLQTGDWKMWTASEELDSVVITARRPPFVIRNDTLEFNAESFRSLPNEMVQDLLRKLPGVRIDEDGNIYVHGKKVDKILVDGREFFSANMRTTTNNLPGGIIDKVQITESRDPFRASGTVIRPLTTTVTMNLTLKKENKKGYFGNVNGTAGTMDRYRAGAFLNSFNNLKRLSINGSTGNIPSIEAGYDGQATGVIKSATSAELNFNDDILRKGRLALYYGFNKNINSTKTITDRVNLVPDNSFLYNSVATTNFKNDNHSVYGIIDLDIDSLQKMRIMIAANLAKTNTANIMDAFSESPDGKPINTQQNFTVESVNPTLMYENTIDYDLSSRDRKTILSLNWRFNNSVDQGSQINMSRNEFATGNADSLDQRGDIFNRGINQSVSMNLNRSLGKYFVAILNYNYNNSRQKDKRDMYRFNSFSGKYDTLDSLYSNDIRALNGSHQAIAKIGYKNEKLAAEVSAVWLSLRQKNDIILNDTSTHVHQQNISPNAAFSYTINPLIQLAGSYSLATIRPSGEQLNPVVDVTNPLIIREGNPVLGSGLYHSYNFAFNFYSHDMKWRTDAGVFGSFVKNQIVENTRYDTLGRQVISFRNVDGNHNYGVRWNGGVQLQLNNYRMAVEVNAAAGNRVAVAFINGELNASKTVGFSPSLNVQLSYKTLFNLSTSMIYETNRTTSSLQGIAPIKYNITRLHVVASINPVKKVQLTTAIFRTYNSQLPVEFQRTKTFMSAGVTVNFLKDERLTAGFIVNDLLNNNINITRNVSAIASETIQTNALKRFAALSLTYRLQQFR